MSVLQLLASENFITVNKTLIKELGLEEAVIFGELCSEYSHWENEDKLIDDMFFCSSSKLEDMTGLSEYKQRNAIKNLVEAGYIEYEIKGLPATRYFKIIQEPVLKLFKVSSEKISELVPKKLSSSNIKINKIEKKKNNIKIEKENFDFGKPKESKPNLYSKCISDIDSRHYDNKLRTALIDYLDLRIQMKDKPLYANSWKGLLNKLERDFKEEERIGVVFQSIERGYASFFPVNQGWKTSQLEKPWEKGVKSRKATKEEELEEEHWRSEQRAKGIKVDF